MKKNEKRQSIHKKIEGIYLFLFFLFTKSTLLLSTPEYLRHTQGASRSVIICELIH